MERYALAIGVLPNQATTLTHASLDNEEWHNASSCNGKVVVVALA
jgi:hypothetical protein